MNTKQIYCLALIVFMDASVIGAVTVTVPFVFKELGGGSLDYSLMYSIYMAMLSLSATLWGWSSDQFGRKSVLLLQFLGHMITMIIFGLANAKGWANLAGALLGIFGAARAIESAAASDLSTSQDRTKAVGFVNAGYTLGVYIFGPLLVSLFSRFGTRVPLFICSGLDFLSFIFCSIYLNLPKVAESRYRWNIQRESWLVLLKNVRLRTLLIITFLFETGFGMLATTNIFFINARFGFSQKEAGILASFLGIASFIVQFSLIGPLVKRVSEVRLLTASFALWSLVIFAYNFATHMGQLIGIYMVVGALLGLVISLLLSLASKCVSAQLRGAALGLIASTLALAQMFGGVLGGFLFDRVSIYGPNLASVIIQLVACIFVAIHSDAFR